MANVPYPQFSNAPYAEMSNRIISEGGARMMATAQKLGEDLGGAIEGFAKNAKAKEQDENLFKQALGLRTAYVNYLNYLKQNFPDNEAVKSMGDPEKIVPPVGYKADGTTEDLKTTVDRMNPLVSNAAVAIASVTNQPLSKVFQMGFQAPSASGVSQALAPYAAQAKQREDYQGMASIITPPGQGSAPPPIPAAQPGMADSTLSEPTSGASVIQPPSPSSFAQGSTAEPVALRTGDPADIASQSMADTAQAPAAQPAPAAPVIEDPKKQLLDKWVQTKEASTGKPMNRDDFMKEAVRKGYDIQAADSFATAMGLKTKKQMAEEEKLNKENEKLDIELAIAKSSGQKKVDTDIKETEARINLMAAQSRQANVMAAKAQQDGGKDLNADQQRALSAVNSAKTQLDNTAKVAKINYMNPSSITKEQFESMLPQLVEYSARNRVLEKVNSGKNFEAATSLVEAERPQIEKDIRDDFARRASSGESWFHKQLQEIGIGTSPEAKFGGTTAAKPASTSGSGTTTPAAQTISSAGSYTTNPGINVKSVRVY